MNAAIRAVTREALARGICVSGFSQGYRSLAKELAPHGITVNTICPGIIETDMWAYNDEHWGALGNYKRAN